jgi:CheY-like chemotaxis protein
VNLLILVVDDEPDVAETKRKALEGRAEALLTKPIDFVMLRSEIDTRVERAE